MQSKTFPVVASNIVEMGRRETRFDVPEGATIAHAVECAIPLADIPVSRVRVVLNGDQGTWEIEPALWSQIKPKPGIQVVVRTVPGRDQLRSVLTVVVSAAAVAYGGAVAAAVFGKGVGLFATQLVTAGLTIVGTLLINALIPAQVSNGSDDAARNTYTINGWQNELRPDSHVPMILGKHRYAPPFAAASYSEIVGDQQYIRALFTPGYGPVRISDIRIGETPIEEFDDVDIEIREGLPTDGPVSLYPRQVLEEGLGQQLTRPFPRDDAGEIIDDSDSIETPVTVFTASDAAEAGLIFAFPQGLFRVNSDGDLRSQSVTVAIRMRSDPRAFWAPVATLDITAQNREPMFRRHVWALPSRGRWEIEVTRITDELLATDASDNVLLSSVQSIRPEYPLNFSKPLALIAVRVRATYQLNGTLDNLNALIERKGPVHSGNGVWTDDYSRNPATAFLIALMGNQNPYPVTEAEINMERMADWFDWCLAKGLKYDRIHDQGESFGDVLKMIAGAGRAAPRHDGELWDVIIDRPDDLIVEHINGRNASDFTWSHNYFDPPDAFRVRFQDETNDYANAERLIPWIGHVGDIDLTEELALPGKTDPDEIYLAAYRRMLELEHRAGTYSAVQSGRARVAQRGDVVVGHFDELDWLKMSARVKSVRGSLVELDAEVPASNDYAMRFKSYANDADLIGTSTVRAIADRNYDTTALRLLDMGPMPEVGSIVDVGPIASETQVLRITGIEAAQQAEARVIMVDAAPIIDEILDGIVVPTWDGRVGAEIAASVLAPAAPVFQHVRTGVDGTGDQDGLEVLLKSGAGSTATVTSFEVDHRAGGGTTWTTVSVAAATGAADIEGYAAADVVELRARAVASGNAGPYTAVLTVTIGADDPTIPGALDDAAIDVLGSLGRAIVGVGVPPDAAIAKLQIYRSPQGTPLDRAAHAVRDPFAVEPGSTASFTDGDATRTNQIVGGGFADASDWTLGTGWTVSGGTANHAPGMAGDLSNDMTFSDGATYRIAFTVSGRTAGSVTPKLTGGATVAGGAIAADGLVQITLVAGAGIAAFTLSADSPFDGSIDDVIIYRQTATSVAAGAWSYWVEPQNSAGVAGAISGPFTVTIY